LRQLWSYPSANLLGSMVGRTLPADAASIVPAIAKFDFLTHLLLYFANEVLCILHADSFLVSPPGKEHDER
jgi:hypothetical protein